MTIQEVYDYLKPMDETLMKRKYMSDGDSLIISAMWEAIKRWKKFGLEPKKEK
uniref:Uncharacterized protein n=1 Tax=viral metagenome TaxID=1070528 RepID=A0A6H1ZRQ4_9ZZZZ